MKPTVNRTIVITGANRGLGRELVQVALERGYKVAAGMRESGLQSAETRALAEAHPGRYLAVAMDVADEASVEKAAETIRKAFGQADILINNAAILIARDQKLEQLTLEAVEQTFQVNLYGPIRVTKHLLPLMTGGEDKAIVNISSEAGSFANAYGGDYPYALSKGALNLFSAHLRNDVAGRGIRVYAVHPGWIRTDMGGETAPGDPLESARGVLDLAEGRKDRPDMPLFVDFRGEPMEP
jgi:NAD(P)-dependent dehydrogenase (short-subunit alcohol dehydrogenase family)